MKSVVSSKGQITLPVVIREQLGLVAGTPVEFELRDGGLLLRKGSADTHPVDRIYGILKLDVPVDVLIDEMRGPRPAASTRRRRRAARKR